ncbi:Hypothetical protein MCYN_0557 [Mycoplasmopsis cynos C142]|uniref:Uncharacterized protein n=1 Tax=Mycoplasmopsis cynos (strain C142) TaxID=1246955 RepID=L0RUU5_MYCC1|nr:Hypothetical protein MCYN_0557 [Mycoplasmopsis cynos C142]
MFSFIHIINTTPNIIYSNIYFNNILIFPLQKLALFIKNKYLFIKLIYLNRSIKGYVFNTKFFLFCRDKINPPFFFFFFYVKWHFSSKMA